MIVLALPPNDSFNNHVRMESLYGTKPAAALCFSNFFVVLLWCFFLLLLLRSILPFSLPTCTPSLNLLMHCPNVLKLLLIAAASLNRVPFAPLFLARSDPAKSTATQKRTEIEKGKRRTKNVVGVCLAISPVSIF